MSQTTPRAGPRFATSASVCRTEAPHNILQFVFTITMSLSPGIFGPAIDVLMCSPELSTPFFVTHHVSRANSCEFPKKSKSKI